jgi:hypothetical protein
MKVPSRIQIVACARRWLTAAILFGCLQLSAMAQASPAAGYWWNPAAAGSGFVIEIQGSTMFMAGFLYTASGNATWVASSGPIPSATQYSGPLVFYTGGQTLTGNYQPATLAPALGNITITFLTDTTALLTWSDSAGSASIEIQRFDIVPGGSGTPQPATNPQTGWWWNPNEGGRGFAIEAQGGQMYFAGYMYDASGLPIWYLASGAMANAALFQGEWEQLANGQTFAGPYKAPVVANANVGAVTVQFTSVNNATLTLPNGRQISLERFNFGATGPTLSAFSPAAAAPASVLNLTGSNFNPSAKFSLTLSDGTGYSVSVPLSSVTSSTATASIPPYFNPASGVFGSGTVNLKLTQTAGGTSEDSNTLQGFNIRQLPVANNAGQGTLALIRANLAEAQKLQSAVLGTALDSPSVEAAAQAEVDDLQQLLTNIQSVVQQGQSFSLGAVGGVNITVTPQNISDVDELILATLQSLVAPTTGSAEKAYAATTPGCMSAEAAAFAQAMSTGIGNFDLLAQSLIEAPAKSAACNTLGAFTSAYQIFAGAGGAGIGMANRAGTPALPAARLPGAALFSATAGNVNVSLGLNALLSPVFANQIPALQFSIGGVTGLALPLQNELIAKASGEFALSLSDSGTLSTLLAPPTLSLGSIVPTDLPNGTYNFSYSFNLTVFGRPQQGSVGPLVLENTDGTAFAALVQGDIDFANSSHTCGGVGVTCTANVQSFNGTAFEVIYTINGPVAGGTITYMLTRTE